MLHFILFYAIRNFYLFYHFALDCIRCACQPIIIRICMYVYMRHLSSEAEKKLKNYLDFWRIPTSSHFILLLSFYSAILHSSGTDQYFNMPYNIIGCDSSGVCSQKSFNVPTNAQFTMRCCVNTDCNKHVIRLQNVDCLLRLLRTSVTQTKNIHNNYVCFPFFKIMPYGLTQISRFMTIRVNETKSEF